MRQKFIVIISVLLLSGIFNVACQQESVTSDSSITVGNIRNTDKTNKVVFLDGKYYYYDAGQSAIICHSSEEETIVVENVMVDEITGNSGNLFFTRDESLYQYCLDEERLIEAKVVSGDWIEDLYANEEYVFVKGDTSIYVFSAQNILDKVDFLTEMSSEILMDEYCIKDLDENFVMTGLLQDMDVKELDNKTVLQNEFGMEFTAAAGNRVFGEAIYLGVYDDSLIQLWEYLNIYKEDDVYSFMNGNITYENAAADYAIESSVIQDDMLIIVASNYGIGNGDFPVSSGILAEHKGDNLWYVNLEQESTWKIQYFQKGKIVWYADKDKYIVFDAGEIITYDAATQEELGRCEADWFEDGGYQYEIVLCHDNWFVFCDNSLIDIIPMDTYLN